MGVARHSLSARRWFAFERETPFARCRGRGCAGPCVVSGPKASFLAADSPSTKLGQRCKSGTGVLVPHAQWGVSFQKPPDLCLLWKRVATVATDDPARRVLPPLPSVQPSRKGENTARPRAAATWPCLLCIITTRLIDLLTCLRYGTTNIRGPHGLGIPVATTGGPLQPICKILSEAGSM